MREESKYKLFNHSGCLTREGIELYCKKMLPGEEMEKIKAHLMHCGFCDEAIEGFETGNVDNHMQNIDEINMEIASKVSSGFADKKRRPLKGQPVFYALASVAAIVLLVFGLLFYLNRIDYPEKQFIAMEEVPDIFDKHIIMPVPGYSRNYDNAQPAGKRDKTRQESKEIVYRDEGLEFNNEPEPESASPFKQAPVKRKKSGAPASATKSISADKADYFVTKDDIFEEQVTIKPSEPVDRPGSGEIVKRLEPYRGKSSKGPSMLNEEDVSPEGIFLIVEQMPTFRGEGIEKFRDYLSKKIVYPDELKDVGIEGQVVTQFVVNAEGKTEDVIIIHGIHPRIDKIVEEAILDSPRWKPGRQRETPVNVAFTIPVNFEIR
ncbi:MAG: energy transducer TonB [Bacteroidales bacterium]